MDKFEGQWADCARCGQPFPIFGAVTDSCTLCRKEAAGESLTKTDLALRYAHQFYRKRLDEFAAILSNERAARTREKEEETRRRTSFDAAELSRLKISVQQQSQEITLLTTQLRQVRASLYETAMSLANAKDEIERLKRSGGPTTTDFDLEQVTFLVKVTHPDRHPDPAVNALATKLAARFNAMRAKMRGR